MGMERLTSNKKTVCGTGGFEGDVRTPTGRRKMSGSENYKKAGVDTDAGRAFARMISGIAKAGDHQNVVKTRTGYGGIFDVSFLKDYDDPVMITTTDGVGTKLHLARLFDRHETVGIDLVGMCSNDILATGAKSTVFLDYIACGKLIPEKMGIIGESIAEGCHRAGAVLIGGETAEHPDTMGEDDYDLAGFMVGVHERSEIVDGNDLAEGDVIIGLPSSGVHSNGLSLVRRLFLKEGLTLPDSSEEQQFLLNEILLRPTIIYEGVLRPLLDSAIPIKGMAHITGGGFFENIPRFLSDDLMAEIDRNAYTTPGLYRTIQEKGGLDDEEMHRVFNMGVGMVLTVSPENVTAAMEILQNHSDKMSPVPEGNISVIGKILKKDGANSVILV